MSFKLDESRFPLVVLAAPGVIEPAAFEAFLSRMDDVLFRGHRFALILDLTGGAPLGARLRRRQADWLATHSFDLERLCAGVGVVSTNPLIRGTLTAILWLQPLPCPHRLVAALPEAEAWCLRELQRSA